MPKQPVQIEWKRSEHPPEVRVRNRPAYGIAAALLVLLTLVGWLMFKLASRGLPPNSIGRFKWLAVLGLMGWGAKALLTRVLWNLWGWQALVLEPGSWRLQGPWFVFERQVSIPVADLVSIAPTPVGGWIEKNSGWDIYDRGRIWLIARQRGWAFGPRLSRDQALKLSQELRARSGRELAPGLQRRPIREDERGAWAQKPMLGGLSLVAAAARHPKMKAKVAAGAILFGGFLFAFAVGAAVVSRAFYLVGDCLDPVSVVFGLLSAAFLAASILFTFDMLIPVFGHEEILIAQGILRHRKVLGGVGVWRRFSLSACSRWKLLPSINAGFGLMDPSDPAVSEIHFYHRGRRKEIFACLDLASAAKTFDLLVRAAPAVAAEHAMLEGDLDEDAGLPEKWRRQTGATDAVWVPLPDQGAGFKKTIALSAIFGALLFLASLGALALFFRGLVTGQGGGLLLPALFGLPIGVSMVAWWFEGSAVEKKVCLGAKALETEVILMRGPFRRCLRKKIPYAKLLRLELGSVLVREGLNQDGQDLADYLDDEAVESVDWQTREDSDSLVEGLDRRDAKALLHWLRQGIAVRHGARGWGGPKGGGEDAGIPD